MKSNFSLDEEFVREISACIFAGGVGFFLTWIFEIVKAIFQV
jgi:hypothetical protein